MNKPKDFLFLVDAFKSLPSIGTKSANRISWFLLLQDKKYKDDFISRFLNATNNLKQCKLCRGITTNEICEMCLDVTLEQSLCIVSSYEDYERMVDAKVFGGYYHVLTIDDKQKHLDLSLIDVSRIKYQIKELNIKEVVIATPFSINGELICQYLSSNLKNDTMSIYRLGFGLPLNAEIDYIDDDTIRESLINKKKIF